LRDARNILLAAATVLADRGAERSRSRVLDKQADDIVSGIDSAITRPVHILTSFHRGTNCPVGKSMLFSGFPEYPATINEAGMNSNDLVKVVDIVHLGSFFRRYYFRYKTIAAMA
jgi:hypothetical protein